jgi:hypothetical protein
MAFNYRFYGMTLKFKFWKLRTGIDFSITFGKKHSNLEATIAKYYSA